MILKKNVFVGFLPTDQLQEMKNSRGSEVAIARADSPRPAGKFQ